MNSDNEILITILNEVHPQLTEIQPLISGLPNLQDKEGVNKCFSNIDLLIKTLKDFYADSGRADYFPKSVTKQVTANITSLSQSIAAYKANFQSLPHAEAVLNNSDTCYAYCLQYGIITFGFEEKIRQEIYDKARSVSSKYQKLLKKAESSLKELENNLKAEITSFKEPLEQDVNKLREQVSSDIKTLSDELQKTRAEKEELISKIEKVNSIYESIIKKDTEADEILKNFNSSVNSSNKEYESLKNLVAEAKTNLDLVKESRTAIKEELESIKEFYSEIENYEKKMTDVKKESNDNINKLVASYEENVNKFKDATDNIISTNQNLQKEIKEHLTKAIGVSLFSAFDKRRGNLNIGKWLWSAVLLLSVSVGIGLTIWIAYELKGDPTTAWYIKLSALVPIAFLVGFSAKQYSNERRAEEEYAFKSAVSISLEPYRDLLFRIRSENPEIDTAFIEELIYEIFDNPVKRIYSGKPSESVIETTTGINPNELLKKITDKFSTEQIKEVKELIGKLTELVKIKTR